VAYRVIVVLIVAIHFAVVAYTAVGGFIALRWRRTIWLHLAFVGWGLGIVLLPSMWCPLTWAEAWARHRAGMPAIPEGFIDHYIQGKLYPTAYTPLLQAVVAVAIAVSWVLWFWTGPDGSGLRPDGFGLGGTGVSRFPPASTPDAPARRPDDGAPHQ
jgi:hypothetical protein